MTVYTDVSNPNGFINSTDENLLSGDGTTTAGDYTNGSGEDVGFVENVDTGAYTDVSDPNGVNGTYLNAITGDGTTVAGYYVNGSGWGVGFVEKVGAGAYTDVRDPNGLGTEVTAISADGMTVAGIYGNGAGTNDGGGFVENVGTGVYTDVSDPNAVQGSTVVTALSADGTTVAGYYLNSGGWGVGFVENVATGAYTDVKDPNGLGTDVTAISADGAFVAGWYASGPGTIAGGFVENVATGAYTNVSDPNGVKGTYVTAISADGRAVAGSYDNSSGYFGGYVEYVGAGAYIDVFDPNGVETYAIAMSADGTTVAGNYFNNSDDKVNFVATDLPCYCRGTRILTDRGEVAVEALAIGDKVVTLHGEARPIKWIGRRDYDGRFVAGKPLMLPVCIRRGAIEDHVPARDLWVSPGHAICLDGVLVPAWLLVNGVSITQPTSVDEVTYIHIEFADHEVIFAEGCPAESFIDDNCRNQFQNAAEFHALYPDRELGQGRQCLPRVEDGFHLAAIQRRLAARAGVKISWEQSGTLRGYVDLAGPEKVAGWAQSETHPEVPVCLDILVDGRRVMRALANRYRADLREAGMGSGKHSFKVALPAGVSGRVEVRRSSDQAGLGMTEAAVALAA